MTLQFPPIGLGTGGKCFLKGADCINVVSSALEMGYRHIDTAQIYGNEAEIGKAIIKSSVPREDLLIASKVAKNNLSYEDVLESARESLKKLQIESIDILYVHFPTDTYKPTETLSAFDKLVNEGLIKHVGVSNFSPDDLDVAREILDHPIVVNQIEMHPLYQQDQLMDYAQKYNIHLVAYSPLARGKVFDLPTINAIAEKYGVSEAVITLAWLTDIEQVSAIPKTTSKAHLQENLGVPNVDLDFEDFRKINSINDEEKFVKIE